MLTKNDLSSDKEYLHGKYLVDKEHLERMTFYTQSASELLAADKKKLRRGE